MPCCIEVGLLPAAATAAAAAAAAKNELGCIDEHEG